MTFLRLVKDDEIPAPVRQTDPLEEIREGAEILRRLTTNPLLPDHAQMAIMATKRVLDRRLPVD